MLIKRIARWSIVLLCVLLFTIKQLYPKFLNILSNIQIDKFSLTLLVIIIITVLLPHITHSYHQFRITTFNYFKSPNKRWIIIITCLLLIILKLFNSSTQIDINIIWLVVIAALLFVLPELKTVTPYVKRVKFGDVELELKEQIGNLVKEVEKAREAAVEKSSTGIPKESSQKISTEVEQVLQESSKNPRAALLLLSSKLEEQLRNRLVDAGISLRPYSISRSVEIGVQRGLFPQEFLPAFRDFWAVRNRVAHGAAFDVDDTYILSLISLGTQLLKLLSTIDGQLRLDL